MVCVYVCVCVCVCGFNLYQRADLGGYNASLFTPSRELSPSDREHSVYIRIENMHRECGKTSSVLNCMFLISMEGL